MTVSRENDKKAESVFAGPGGAKGYMCGIKVFHCARKCEMCQGDSRSKRAVAGSSGGVPRVFCGRAVCNFYTTELDRNISTLQRETAELQQRLLASGVDGGPAAAERAGGAPGVLRAGTEVSWSPRGPFWEDSVGIECRGGGLYFRVGGQLIFRASLVPKLSHVRWKVQNMSAICSPNLFMERPMQDNVCKLSAKHCHQIFLTFYESRAVE